MIKIWRLKLSRYSHTLPWSLQITNQNFNAAVLNLLPSCLVWNSLTPSSCLSSGLWMESRQKITALQLRSLIFLPLQLRLSYPALIHLPQVNTHTYIYQTGPHSFFFLNANISPCWDSEILTNPFHIHRGPWWWWHHGDYCQAKTWGKTGNTGVTEKNGHIVDYEHQKTKPKVWLDSSICLPLFRWASFPVR